MQALLLESMGKPRGSVSGSRLFSSSQTLGYEKSSLERHSHRFQFGGSGMAIFDECLGIQMATPCKTSLVSGS